MDKEPITTEGLEKLKNLEMKWIENNFNLSKKDMEKVLSN